MNLPCQNLRNGLIRQNGINPLFNNNSANTICRFKLVNQNNDFKWLIGPESSNVLGTWFGLVFTPAVSFHSKSLMQNITTVNTLFAVNQNAFTAIP